MRTHQALACLALSSLTLLVSQPAIAGPNAGGTLIVHSRPDIEYCADTPTYCGLNDYSGGCAGLSTNLPSDPAITHVWWVTAAFPASSSPQLRGLTFGIAYEPSSLALVGWGKCGNFEIPDPTWPQPNSGTSMTWGTSQTGHLVDAYWFAGYTYQEGDYSFRLRTNPIHGGDFADNSVPSVLDPIADFGSLGFGNHPGYLPCPGGVGACCLPDGACQQTSHALCAGTWLGSSVSCDVDPCAIGACCLADGTCRLLSGDNCGVQGGSYQGALTTCEPQPCTVATGACCLPDGTCEVLTEASCVASEGTFVWNGVACDPSPCERPHYLLTADGSGDLPTIQSAVNASEDGAVIELADGTYTGAGNHGVDFLGKAIVIRSQSGSASACIIDCQSLDRGFIFESGEGASAGLERVSVINGHAGEGGDRSNLAQLSALFGVQFHRWAGGHGRGHLRAVRRPEDRGLPLQRQPRRRHGRGDRCRLGERHADPALRVSKQPRNQFLQ